MIRAGRDEMISAARANAVIVDAIVKADSVLRAHERPICAVSGGKDSDIMLDIIWNLDMTGKVRYVFYDTGLEMAATKRHLSYLEERYGIDILRARPQKTVPMAVKEYGVPFLSKYVSSQLERLCRHGFRYEDENMSVLLPRYPGISSGIKWWCSAYNRNGNGQYDIGRNKWLREFMTEHPPAFRISSKCCTYAKEKLARSVAGELHADLDITGIRRGEGGIRAAAYSSCFTGGNGMDHYRPIFWMSSEDERQYQRISGIRHSDCYTVYGMERTGCIGCPFNRRFEKDRDTLYRYEPRLARAADKIFGESYAYTRAYREYAERMERPGQMSIKDLMEERS